MVVRAVEDAAAVIELARAELAEILVGQDLGKTDDGVQGRAQLVGDVGDELALEATGGLQRLVALAQRMLDPRRIGDVEIAQQHIAVRQRHDHRLQDGAIPPYETRALALMRGEARDDAALERRPVAAIVEEGALLLDDVADMRLAREIGGRELPHLRIGRVRQLEAPVAAEHGDRLVKVVERLALHLDQGVVGSLERELVGDILVDEGDPAERMRRDDEAQRALVRQMQQLLLRLDQRGEHGELLPFEGAEIGVLGNAPSLAQPLEHFIERRFGDEPVLLEPPQAGKGGVEESKLRVGAVDGDRHGDVLEHVGMRRDMARQLGLDVLEVGEVLGEAGQLARAVERRLGELHQPARAGNDDMMAFRLRHHRAARPSGKRPPALADRAGGDLAPLGQRLLRRRIDRRGIGAVAVDEPEIGAAAPHRQRQQIEHAAQALVLHAPGRAFRRGLGATRRVDEPEQVGHRCAVISREAAPACIQRRATRDERERHAEAGAVGAKLRHCRLERRRILGLEPR